MQDIHLTRLFLDKRQMARRAREGEIFLIHMRKQPIAYLVSSSADDAVRGVQFKGRVWEQEGAAIYLLDYPLSWSGVLEPTDADALLQIPPVILSVMQAQGIRLPATAECDVLGPGAVLLRFVDLAVKTT